MTVYQNEDGTKVEYRVWNPFRSKLAAAILGGVDNIWIVSHESGLFIYSFIAHISICLIWRLCVCLVKYRNLVLKFSILEPLLVLQSHTCLTLLVPYVFIVKL